MKETRNDIADSVGREENLFRRCVYLIWKSDGNKYTHLFSILVWKINDYPLNISCDE